MTNESATAYAQAIAERLGVPWARVLDTRTRSPEQVAARHVIGWALGTLAGLSNEQAAYVMGRYKSTEHFVRVVSDGKRCLRAKLHQPVPGMDGWRYSDALIEIATCPALTAMIRPPVDPDVVESVKRGEI